MLEARLSHASILKKILDAVKDIVTDANFDCSDSGISLQAMDSSHVSLVALLLRASGFDHYRCDRSLNLGISIPSLAKIIKTAGNDDALTLRAEDAPDVLNMLFEAGNGRVAEYDLKLMDIDADHLGIPETIYDAVVKMSSAEFTRICRDLQNLSESVVFDCTKEGIRFSSEGDIGSGSVFLKPSSGSIDEEEEDSTTIELNTACTLTFSLKYLMNFTKAAPLSKSVTLSLSTEVPLLVEYKVSEVGYVRYYLAPKVDDEM